MDKILNAVKNEFLRSNSDRVLLYVLFFFLGISLVFCCLVSRFVHLWWLDVVIYANLCSLVLIVIRVKSVLLFLAILTCGVLLPGYTVIPYLSLVNEEAKVAELTNIGADVSEHFFFLQYKNDIDNILIRTRVGKASTDEVSCYGRFYPYRSWFCEGLYKKYIGFKKDGVIK